jgi:hypothetical protein
VRLGIVGHEAAKFTPLTEIVARDAIREKIRSYAADEVCSGECPLGGIDIWAREEATALGLPFIPFPPKENNWENGFKPRNLQIAASDVVVCIVVKELPPTYKGRRFNGCYHCLDRNLPHIKSGGCWTAWRAKRREWVII